MTHDCRNWSFNYLSTVQDIDRYIYISETKTPGASFIKLIFVKINVDVEEKYFKCTCYTLHELTIIITINYV